MTDTVNEVELLILVRPELVEAMDCNEVPPGGPGAFSRNPTDCELYLKGYLEVPMRPHAGAPPVGPTNEEVSPQAVPLDRREPPAGAAVSRSGPTLAVESRDNSNNRANVQNRQKATPANSNPEPPGLIGPVGYDVKN